METVNLDKVRHSWAAFARDAGIDHYENLLALADAIVDRGEADGDLEDLFLLLSDLIEMQDKREFPVQDAAQPDSPAHNMAACTSCPLTGPGSYSRSGRKWRAAGAPCPRRAHACVTGQRPRRTRCSSIGSFRPEAMSKNQTWPLP